MTPELEKDIVSAIGKPDPVILDIGCNDGSDTLAFLSLFPGARVFCFEPEPRAQRKFAALVLDKRATLFPLALGAVDGTVTFHRSSGRPHDEAWEPWDFSGSILKPKNHLQVHPWCTFSEQIEVPVARLDTWVAQHSVKEIDFIWADVQGAEGELVAGGMETLSRARHFYTEYNDHEMYAGQPTLKQLQSMLPEFEVVKIYTDDVLFRNVRMR